VPDKLPAYAFAGSATDGAGANIEENLSEWLPDECMLFVPNRVPKGTPLKDTIRWLEDVYEDDDISRVDDITRAMQHLAMTGSGQTIQLLMLYNPDSATDQDLVRAAYEFDIGVHDILNGMYAIPLPDEEDTPPWEPGEKDSALEAAPVEAASDGREDTVEAFPEPVTGTPSPVLDRDESELTRNILESFRALIREELIAMGLTPGMNKPPVVVSDAPQEVPTGPADQPVSAPPPLPADVSTKRYTRDAKGIHRPRTRGRLKAGLVQVELTDAEAEALRADGKLIGN
jgi:hypothetical protein